MSGNFDFRAFYCAGSAVVQGADPYRTQPLHSCEQKKTDGVYAAFARETVLPAPQPPYVLPFFAALALLPFAVASKVWVTLLLFCAAGAIVLCARIANVSYAVSTASLWLSLGVTSIYLGELIPVFVCALAASAYFAQRQQWTAAGCCALATLAEPHLGLAVCASFALWAPRSRMPVLAGILAAAGLSIITAGPSVAIEYVRYVLPLHALSELGSDAQLSAAVLAHAAGAPDGAALRAGSVSFVLAAVLGIGIAPVLASTYRDRAFLALTPAAFSLIGGVFLHVTDLAAAVPFALLLFHHSSERRGLAAFALVLLAVPWFALTTPMLLGTAPGCMFAAISVLFLVRWCSGNNALALTAACAAGFGAFGLVHAYQLGTAHAASVPHPAIPAIYPQASWAAFNADYASSSFWSGWALRALSWSALLCGAAAACASVAGRPARVPTVKASAKLRV
jgi:hypothetical protein